MKTNMQTQKEIEIQAWLDRPIRSGDNVNIVVPYSASERVKVKGKWTDNVIYKVKNGYGTVTGMDVDKALGKIIRIKTDSWSRPNNAVGIPKDWSRPSEYGDEWYLAAWVTPCTMHIGSDPFVEGPDIRFQNLDIEGLFMKAGYGYRDDTYDKPKMESLKSGGTYGGCNFDPYVIDSEGKRKHYQRGYVWTEEQKRDLISTIYAGGEIGKFVFRYKSWEALEKQAKEDGHGYNWDCVDGKQRFHALLEFVQGKFADEYGNCWKDLSERAQRKFMRYCKLAFGQLDEGATDGDTIAAFLHVNVKGTPVSKEHINDVKNIKI